jgi:hypothetical protein
MNDIFERRVRAASVAGWWVVLLAAGLLTLSWFAYLLAMSSQPGWLLSLWGPGIDWDDVQSVWFWAIVVFKLTVWLMIMIVVWLTLWARELRKPSGGK